MKKNKIKLFVPGRLCILGEHSDWAAKYRKNNKNINKGYAIVTGIEEGIYAKAMISDKLRIYNKKNKKSFECNMDVKELNKIAKSDDYWSYVSGVAACIKKKYKNVKGINVIIKKSTIPEKKGLASSAAICVLITKAFNKLYNLNLSLKEEMEIAYLGEISTLSKCGKLDQACAYGKRPILLTFDKDNIEATKINVKEPMYFIFADLMAKKDTLKILNDLNKIYSNPKTKKDKNVFEALGKDNEKIVLDCIKNIENGNIENVGKIMNKAQKNFDKKVAPACMEELESPILHSILNNNYIKELSYGMKGVGSQGDGTVQVLAKDKKSQKKIYKYFKKVLKMKPYKLTIKNNQAIKRAIIPVAGDGIRMYPATKCIKKSFMPVINNNNEIKPMILYLVEEVVDAGIEKIALVIDKKDKKEYKRLFKKRSKKSVRKKLSDEQRYYDDRLKEIGNKIKFIKQKKKLGLGHAVYLCKKFSKKKPTLLVLGDQLYKSKSNTSCTEQFLKYYDNNYEDNVCVSVCSVPEKDINKYGIIFGNKAKSNNYYKVDKIVEKPTLSVAKKYKKKYNIDNDYYAFFGEYIINKDVFDLLKRNIKEERKENNEYQITSVLEEIRNEKGINAFIPNGSMLDLGNVNSYKNSFIEYNK